MKAAQGIKPLDDEDIAHINSLVAAKEKRAQQKLEQEQNDKAAFYKVRRNNIFKICLYLWI